MIAFSWGRWGAVFVLGALVADALGGCSGKTEGASLGSSGGTEAVSGAAGAAGAGSAGAGSAGASAATSGAGAGMSAGASGAVASGSASGLAQSGAASGGAASGFAIALATQDVSKVDILFDIDNSASMGDKEGLLAQAIPDLIDGLVNPACVSTADGKTVVGKSTLGGGCPAGSKAAFASVRDMHLGVVTSSLGQRLSETDPTFATGVCNPQAAEAPYQALSAHMDDQAHLVTRALAYAPPSEAQVSDALPGFLYWYPEANGNGINGPPAAGETPVGAPANLEADLASMVTGTGFFGCGIESQLESWYRFLVQPDPYASLALDPISFSAGQPKAQWVGVDTTIIQQRHDFLRPDSVVVVVDLTDENDSEIDVRSLGGLGYFFMKTTFTPPHATSICASSPLAPGCKSCSPGSSDPSCVAAGGVGGVAVYTATNVWGEDMNLRHVHMRQKYGLDPQYPIERYSWGLSSPTISDRHLEYPPGASDYAATTASTFNCTNPLFAARLPTAADLSVTAATSVTVSPQDVVRLCSLPPGTRTPGEVFYAHIGGVPHQLLHYVPGDPAASALTPADWKRILGNDPEHYDYNGIDPHMIESSQPREAITGITFDDSMTNPLAAPTTMGGADPVNGRETITDQPPGRFPRHVDLEYACTFPLAHPHDCTQAANAYDCDCPSTMAALQSHDQVPSVCDDIVWTSQTYGKAYPTIRELEVAKLLGPQGIVSSICPIHSTDNVAGNDPLFGYRPAMASIVGRVGTLMGHGCLPRALPVQPNGAAACSLLVTLPGPGSCLHPTCQAPLAVPAPSALASFCARQEAAYGGLQGAPGDPALQSVCELPQLTKAANSPADFDAYGSCLQSVDKGWCYVQGVDACAQDIVIATSSLPVGALTTLVCAQ